MFTLGKGFGLQFQAKEAIMTYGTTMKLDVQKMILSFGDESSAMAIAEYKNDDDEHDPTNGDGDYDDYDNDVDEDDLEVLEVGSKTSGTVFSITQNIQEGVNAHLAHFTSTICSQVIAPLSSILQKRIAQTPVSSESFFPLTSRSVERLFSSWKRMMDRNADTKPSTMQALLLLSQFDFRTTMNILKQSPLTQTITNYLNGIKTQNHKKVFDALAYNKLLQKNISSQRHQQLTRVFTELRITYRISRPLSGRLSLASLWTVSHSKAYMASIGYSLTASEKKFHARQLRDRVLQLSGNYALMMEPYAGIMPAQEQLSLTHVVEEETYEIEQVLDFRVKGAKKSIYEYKVKWVGYEDESWIKETDFVGLSLCDFWKDKIEAEHGIPETPTSRLLSECGTCEASTFGLNDYYIITNIKNHNSIEGVMFYDVVWAGQGERSWVSENQFDDDVLLTKYWKKIYIELNK
jgi:hypothetical protein